MPTTECRCDHCGHTYHQLTFSGDPIDPLCPRCKKKKVTIKTGPDRFMSGSGMGSRLAGTPKGPS